MNMEVNSSSSIQEKFLELVITFRSRFTIFSPSLNNLLGVYNCDHYFFPFTIATNYNVDFSTKLTQMGAARRPFTFVILIITPSSNQSRGLSAISALLRSEYSVLPCSINASGKSTRLWRRVSRHNGWQRAFKPGLGWRFR